MKRLLIIAALAAGSAHAEFYTGNQILNQMQGTASEKMHAMGFVVGVGDVWEGIRYCPGAGVTAGQVTDVVQRYLEANPQSRHKTAEGLVVLALSTAWPCAPRPTTLGRSL